MDEIWKDIVGFEGYCLVSSFGRIKNAKTGRIRKYGIRCGYLYCALWKDQKAKYPNVHTVVAEAFIGPRPEGMDVDHIDNCRTNARADNLRYVTRSVNIKKTFNGKRKGISLMRKTKNTPQRYRSDIWIGGRKYFLGSWSSSDEAMSVYQKTHIEFFGYI
jgi:hypothetical protein